MIWGRRIIYGLARGAFLATIDQMIADCKMAISGEISLDPFSEYEVLAARFATVMSEAKALLR